MAQIDRNGSSLVLEGTAKLAGPQVLGKLPVVFLPLAPTQLAQPTECDGREQPEQRKIFPSSCGAWR